MMKFDYDIVWLKKAEIKLFHQTDYILQQSQNPIISEQFYDAIKSEVDKLLYRRGLSTSQEKRNSDFKRKVSSKIPDRSGKCLYRGFQILSSK